eukprot:TRINITY_DN6601_c0_g2_i1.p1 TRINITY_DN6601_c0_g2~~TRINITY_DN6601_c0_g2_i1.p1  ORF type:complete len:294 (-),score=-49.26 TRINITY_DN6601_c0_g2_i1:38-919(-)
MQGEVVGSDYFHVGVAESNNVRDGLRGKRLLHVKESVHFPLFVVPRKLLLVLAPRRHYLHLLQQRLHLRQVKLSTMFDPAGGGVGDDIGLAHFGGQGEYFELIGGCQGVQRWARAPCGSSLSAPSAPPSRLPFRLGVGMMCIATYHPNQILLLYAKCGQYLFGGFWVFQIPAPIFPYTPADSYTSCDNPVLFYQCNSAKILHHWNPRISPATSLLRPAQTIHPLPTCLYLVFRLWLFLHSLRLLDIWLLLGLWSRCQPCWKPCENCSCLCLSLIHICRCRRIERCRSRWSPYH